MFFFSVASQDLIYEAVFRYVVIRRAGYKYFRQALLALIMINWHYDKLYLCIYISN
jgi:hypothetical protein